MKKKAIAVLAAALVVCGAAVAALKVNSRDFSEYCETAYSDIISSLVIGYQTHWEEGSPESLGLSPVYGCESAYGAFAQQDINGDGIKELLIGDCFENGGYVLYDIFTFDKRKGDVIHLLCGGEEDTYTLNGQGVVIGNTGSFKIGKSSLKKYSGPVTRDLMVPDFDYVLRYVAPTAYVALEDGRICGQLLRTFDDSYLVECQDSVRIPKEGVEIELWSAFDGKGIVFPKTFGRFPVFEAPDEGSEIIGRMILERGELPETAVCLGYTRDWFRVEFKGNTGYVRDADFDWDCFDRF